MAKLDPVGRGNRFLFGWVKERFPTVPWADVTRQSVETVQRQLPRSHTEKYELKTVWYWYPLYCLGGISFVAFLVTVITGIILGFYYVPDGTDHFTTEGLPTNPARESVACINGDPDCPGAPVPFGFIMRGLHHWSAHMMIAAVFLHMCRVYFTGAYKKPRELNWLIGVVLLLMTLLFGYSGYLLPANDLSGGAATIGINMAKASPGPPWLGEFLANLVFSGTDVLTANYILRMYWIHVFVLPLIATLLMLLHMALVWVQGVAEPH